MRVYISLLVLLACTTTSAQDTTITIKAGNSISDVLTSESVMLYPQFVKGIVYFRDDTKAGAKMNYNSLYDQVLFINTKGDTLAVRDELNIKYIALGQDTFFYNEGYIRLVGGSPNVKLAERRVWEVANTRKIAAHNKATNTYAVTSMMSVTDNVGRTYNLVLNEDLVMQKRSVYYFGDRFYQFVAADKKKLLHHFPKEDDHIASYLKDNKVNFTDKNDLLKLTAYLEQSNH